MSEQRSKRQSIVFHDPQLATIEKHAAKNKWSFGLAVRDLVDKATQKKAEPINQPKRKKP